MATTPKEPLSHYYTLDEYFALEHAGHARYEYWAGEIVCMSGGSLRHTQIASNVHYRLRQKLEGGPCRAFVFELPVKAPTLPPYRYPDIVTACGELVIENIRGIDVLTNPVLLGEVLSPTTEDRDREAKFAAYQTLAAFREYLLIAQHTTHVIHYTRHADGRWLREDKTDLTAALTLESVGCTLALREVYEDVSFLGG